MPDDMSLDAYLARGGVLTSPANVPARYRAELMRMMATFVDSELAGAAGFAEIINEGPGVKERIAAARIVMEKTLHADAVLSLMGEFGVDAGRYATHHPWSDRLARDAPVGAGRGAHDMRLAVFNYPLAGWTDAVAMNLLMGLAVGVQLSEHALISYQPLAEAARRVAPAEAHHTELAEEGLVRLIEGGGREAVCEGVAYWWPRVATSFGGERSPRHESLRAMGLRHRSGPELRARWEAEARAALRRLALEAPAA